jgi:Cytochrome C oxidase, cbb3-type, subunit III
MEKTMTTKNGTRRWVFTMAGLGLLLIVGSAIFISCSTYAEASPPWRIWRDKHSGSCRDCDGPESDVGGSWHWMRSPDEEKRVVMGLFNRYCMRCHDVNGRGSWDIPGVPDFTNARWQASRPDDRQIVRIIIEGRGAVMPPFRGTLSLEEAWAMARHLRTFEAGKEVHRPDLSPPDMKLPGKLELPKDKKLELPKDKKLELPMDKKLELPTDKKLELPTDKK